MEITTVEHIKSQAFIVARHLGDAAQGERVITDGLKDDPQLIEEAILWLHSTLERLTKEQIQKWIDQNYHIIANGVPETVIGNLWEYLDRLDEEQNVFVLEDLLNWRDEELALIGKAGE